MFEIGREGNSFCCALLARHTDNFCREEVLVIHHMVGMPCNLLCVGSFDGYYYTIAKHTPMEEWVGNYRNPINPTPFTICECCWISVMNLCTGHLLGLDGNNV